MRLAAFHANVVASESIRMPRARAAALGAPQVQPHWGFLDPKSRSRTVRRSVPRSVDTIDNPHPGPIDTPRFRAQSINDCGCKEETINVLPAASGNMWLNSFVSFWTYSEVRQLLPQCFLFRHNSSRNCRTCRIGWLDQDHSEKGESILFAGLPCCRRGPPQE